MRPTLTVIADPADRWMMQAACVGQAPAYDENASQWEQRKAQALCLTSCPVIESPCRPKSEKEQPFTLTSPFTSRGRQEAFGPSMTSQAFSPCTSRMV